MGVGKHAPGANDVDTISRERLRGVNVSRIRLGDARGSKLTGWGQVECVRAEIGIPMAKGRHAFDGRRPRDEVLDDRVRRNGTGCQPKKTSSSVGGPILHAADVLRLGDQPLEDIERADSLQIAAGVMVPT